jgi:hypothetical protein
MKILTITGNETAAVNLKQKPQGVMALDAGYYLCTFNHDGKQPRAEVLHIYGGMTSSVERTLYNSIVISGISDLKRVLAMLPDNTVDTPYDIVLLQIYASGDIRPNLMLSDYSSSFSEALNGKFVNLDLAYGVTSISSYMFYECTSLVSITIPNIRKTARFT